ncbi:hypothetical protein V3481_017130 [Fusarium oxysporum f. sp. vasinfectum]
MYPGSPAHWYGVPLRSFIISIDGKPVSCITSLLSVISQIPSNKEFMMVIKDCSGQSREVTLKKDESFFPTTEWRHFPWVPRGWEKVSSDKKRRGHYVERSVKRARPEISQDVDGRPVNRLLLCISCSNAVHEDGHNDTHVNNYEQALDNQLSDLSTDSDRVSVLTDDNDITVIADDTTE